ncbi:MAG: hypothetical protein LBR83_06470 [Clostridiales bacterium]|jgi:hypothetical protein|nr:hypothetical protein [Clostridiales bacterium]
MDATTEKIIDELLHIEQMADSVLQRHHDSLREMPHKIDAEVTRLVGDINAETQLKIDQMRQESAAGTEARIAEIKADFHRRAALIEEDFNINRTRWRTELFDRILSQ